MTLVGKTVKQVEVHPPEAFGFDFGPNVVIIVFDDDTTISALADEEGNAPGVIVWTQQDGGSGYVG